MALRLGWLPRSTVKATTSKPRVSWSHLTATVVSRPPEKARTIFSAISPLVARRRRGRPAARRPRRRSAPAVGAWVEGERNEDRVVAGERADHFRPGDRVHGRGDRIRRARRRGQNRDTLPSPDGPREGA